MPLLSLAGVKISSRWRPGTINKIIQDVVQTLDSGTDSGERYHDQPRFNVFGTILDFKMHTRKDHKRLLLSLKLNRIEYETNSLLPIFVQYDYA